MISFEKTQYAQALSTLSDWKVTTVIRTHYYLKPHVVDRKMTKLFRKINGSLFYVTEFDRDAYESYQPSNSVTPSATISSQNTFFVKNSTKHCVTHIKE